MRARWKKNLALFVVASFAGIFIYALFVQPQNGASQEVALLDTSLDKKYQKIVFAGGCFWCTEAEFNHSPGVVSTVSGYIGGTKLNPTYEEVSTGTTGHREAVLVYYNTASTTLEKLLRIYWKHIDPTDRGGSFADRGYQYTSAIYYTTEEQKEKSSISRKRIIDAKKFESSVATEILPYSTFFTAEEYHQDYKDKNPVRYKYYREGSGRDTFIKNNWVNDTTTFMETKKSTSTKKWESFVKPGDEELRAKLTKEQYVVTQKGGTESPYSNEYTNNKEDGIYVDIISGEPLFLSTHKYDSGTGWPSFVKPVAANSVILKEDKKLFSTRTEVRSAIADSHLGHVFTDGPQDMGGMRYCMNSASLKFIPRNDMAEEGYEEYLKEFNQ